jgi:hypothetical protein
VRGEPHDLCVLQQPTADLPLVIGDHGLELIEEQRGRHATEAGKGLFQTAHQAEHRLARIESQPQQPRVSQYDDQRVALAPRQAEFGDVDLTLVAGWGLEAHPRVRRRRRPHLANAVLHLRVATLLARCPDLLEQADRRDSLGNSAMRAGRMRRKALTLHATGGRARPSSPAISALLRPRAR